QVPAAGRSRAAVDGDDHARHEARQVRCQEDDDVGVVVWLPEPPERQPVPHHAGVATAEHGVGWRLEGVGQVGGDGVHAHAVATQLDGQATGEGVDARVERRVHGVGGDAAEGLDGRHVDDAPRAPLDHGRGQGVGAAEDVLEVEGVERGPLVLGRAQESAVGAVVADVVDGHVEAAAVDAEGGGAYCGHDLGRADVTGDADSPPARRLDVGEGRRQQVAVDVVDDHQRTLGRQPPAE